MGDRDWNSGLHTSVGVGLIHWVIFPVPHVYFWSTENKMRALSKERLPPSLDQHLHASPKHMHPFLLPPPWAPEGWPVWMDYVLYLYHCLTSRELEQWEPVRMALPQSLSCSVRLGDWDSLRDIPPTSWSVLASRYVHPLLLGLPGLLAPKYCIHSWSFSTLSLLLPL